MSLMSRLWTTVVEAPPPTSKSSPPARIADGAKPLDTKYPPISSPPPKLGAPLETVLDMWYLKWGDTIFRIDKIVIDDAVPPGPLAVIGWNKT